MKITITTPNNFTAPFFTLTELLKRALASFRGMNWLFIEDAERGITITIEETKDA